MQTKTTTVTLAIYPTAATNINNALAKNEYLQKFSIFEFPKQNAMHKLDIP